MPRCASRRIRVGKVGCGEADVVHVLAALRETAAERAVVQRAEELDLGPVRVHERGRGHDVLARLPALDQHDRLLKLAGVELREDRAPVLEGLVEVGDDEADVREVVQPGMVPLPG